MPHALLAALLVASATATAQTPAPDGAAVKTPAPPAAASDAPAIEEVRREVEQKLEEAKKEVREEIRAQLATQSIAAGWQEEWVEEKRKLELFELDGYFRMRPNLFYKFDLNRAEGDELVRPSPRSNREQTQAGANMRLRLDPTLNVSEQVRVHMQVDIFDNLVMGSLPDSAFTGDDRNQFVLFSESQSSPRSAINAVQDSVTFKRAYGEVTTPVGILRFGRMGSQWGLGMLRNDGNCLDCDYGDTVDRVQFVTEPLPGYFITPMLDFSSEGPSSAQINYPGEPFDLSNGDDSLSLVLAIARRDTDQQVKAKLNNNQGVLQYGLHFTYRTQKYDPVGYYAGAYAGEGGDRDFAGLNNYVPRGGSLYVPDLWVRYEEKRFRLELEFAAILGKIQNRALDGSTAADLAFNQPLSITQFGGVLQSEYRFLDNALKVGLELGFASGDKAAGFGNYPRRVAGSAGPGGRFEGPQYACGPGGCTDSAIRNFRFNRDYRIDMILWRELLGGVTDATYVRPSVKYSVAEGFDVFGAVIYSRAIYEESTTGGDNNLGLEFNVGTRYETEDGFIAGVAWGILFPLEGLNTQNTRDLGLSIETAQSVRGMVGIKF